MTNSIFDPDSVTLPAYPQGDGLVAHLIALDAAITQYRAYKQDLVEVVRGTPIPTHGPDQQAHEWFTAFAKAAWNDPRLTQTQRGQAYSAMLAANLGAASLRRDRPAPKLSTRPPSLGQQLGALSRVVLALGRTSARPPAQITIDSPLANLATYRRRLTARSAGTQEQSGPTARREAAAVPAKISGVAAVAAAIAAVPEPQIEGGRHRNHSSHFGLHDELAPDLSNPSPSAVSGI